MLVLGRAAAPPDRPGGLCRLLGGGCDSGAIVAADTLTMRSIGVL
jgi:hypothetical protein